MIFIKFFTATSYYFKLTILNREIMNIFKYSSLNMYAQHNMFNISNNFDIIKKQIEICYGFYNYYGFY